MEQQKLMKILGETGHAWMEAMKATEDQQETFWNSLSKEDQIKCFCAVSRRIYKGEIEDRGTYRYVLYDVFHFGPEAYVQAQDAGYLAIHNTLWDGQDSRQTVKMKNPYFEDKKDCLDDGLSKPYND
jgi:hypothetical protein